MEFAGEILNINNEYASYADYKAAVDEELKKSAESFVRIGYLLKVARDTDILKESGYSSVNDFAWNEYKLEKTQVSRFIRINDEFSEGGYSAVLQERYRGIGYAKLAIMLTLPAAVNEELSANYSKAEIQTVKEEIEAERTISDLEVMMERKDPDQRDLSFMTKIMHQLGHDDAQLYLKLFEATDELVYEEHEGDNTPMIKKVMDVLAPSGEGIHTVRIPGEGRKMLSLKGAETDPVVIDIRSNEKTSCSWYELLSAIQYNQIGMVSAKESWEMVYKEDFPVMEEAKKEEVAPVQPNKTSKVTKAKVEKHAEKPKKPEKTQLEQQYESDEPNESCEVLSSGSSPERAAEEQPADTYTDESTEPGEFVSEENAGTGDAAESGSAGDDEERERTIVSLLKGADKVSGDIYDYFMETYENVENMKLEDITLEELQGIKAKVIELSMILDKMIEIKKGEE